MLPVLPPLVTSTYRPACRIGIVIGVLAALLVGSMDARAADLASTEAKYRGDLLPLLRTYCFDCHDSGSEISLESDHSAKAIAGNRKTWIRASPSCDSARCRPRMANHWIRQRESEWPT